MKLRDWLFFVALGVSAQAAISALAGAEASAGELVMFETSYCPSCKQFEKEVGHAYGSSKAGRILPIRRIDIDHDTHDVVLTGPIVMTPTYAFVEHGIEIARLKGYPGAKIFQRIVNRVVERLVAKP